MTDHHLYQIVVCTLVRPPRALLRPMIDTFNVVVMTHGLFERAYRRWKSSPRAEKEAEKSIWEAARRPSQFHQPIAPLVESDDPRYSAKSDSEYKISFLLGGEEAIAPASPRLRYTLVPRDDQDSPSNTSRSSPAIDRPRRFLHKGSRAHRQSRHGSKERMHSRGLRRGPFSAKFETLIKRKPPVSFTNIGKCRVQDTFLT